MDTIQREKSGRPQMQSPGFLCKKEITFVWNVCIFSEKETK